MSLSWEALYAQRVRWMKDSVTMDFQRLAAIPGMISFFAGLPDPGLYPIEDLATAVQHVLTEDGRGALQYAPQEGYRPLKTYLVERLKRVGVPAREEDMLIVTGSIQGLDLVSEMLIDPGDTVVVENPTFSGAIEVFDKYGASYIPIDVDEDGMVVDDLEPILQGHPVKFIYTMPNFHNPMGVDLSVERRKKLLELSDRYGVPIVTDDPYGELRYRGVPAPHLRALKGDANVIMLSTFSKLLAPGMRLGWLLAPHAIVRPLRLGKLTADRSTNHLSQRIVCEMGKQGMLERHLERMISIQGQKLECMLAAMAECFPPEVRWTKPEGGYFVWVTLPPGMDAMTLLQDAEAERVAFVPGASFFAKGGGENTLRLCFVNTPLRDIPEGIRRLARVLSTALSARTEARGRE